MFERFPQLRRLERLLSKAQGPSSKKVKSPPPRRERVDTLMTFAKQKAQGNQLKVAYLTTVDSASEYSHPVQMASGMPDAIKLSTVDDEAECKQNKTVSSHQNKEKKVERRRLWSTALRSPREMFRGKQSNSKSSKTLEKIPIPQAEQERAHIPKPPIKRIFHRQMQEHPASDGLDVLSEEEIDDQEGDEETEQTLRYPLPTMPLSIMVPVEDLPDYIVPMDFDSMMNKSSRFDPNLTALMECRNRLASSYTLFDDLCTSFRGQDNLERFLRSLLAAGSYTVGRTSPPHCDAQHAKEDQSNPSTSVVPDNSSVESSCPTSCAPSTTSNESRLMRLTVSARMKRVETFANRPKRVMAADASTDCSAYGGYGRRPSINQAPSRARTPAKRMTKGHHTPPPLPEEEAREEMMYRVRRGLLNLPWILRRRSSSFSRISDDHSTVPPIHVI